MYTFYDISLILCSTIFEIMLLSHSNIDGADIIYLASYISAVWMLQSYLQTIKFFGDHIIMLNRLLSDALKFMLVAVLIFSGFNLIMFKTSTIYGDCHNVFTVSFSSAFYHLLQLMLNLIAVDELTLSETSGFKLVHALFVVTVSIILVNYLIAVMSNNIASISNSKNEVMVLHRLSYNQWMKGYLYTFLLKKWLPLNKKYIIIDNRIYISCLEYWVVH